MAKVALASPREQPEDKIVRHAVALSGQLQSLRERMYPPHAQKALRNFMTQEVSRLTSIPELSLRTMSNEGKGPVPARLDNNHRAYTLAQINELRRMFAAQKPADALRFLPRRRRSDHLQILAVVNFKGGSAKTTTSAHLAHFLALRGYRVLAIDLDPQASLSAMFGAQPEMDVGDNETIYAPLRYGPERRPMRDVIRHTYFDGIDLIPGNIEVMDTSTRRRACWPRGAALRTTFSSSACGLPSTKLKKSMTSWCWIRHLPLASSPLVRSTLRRASSVTVHPAMLDVMSMSQFLLMMSDMVLSTMQVRC